MKKIFAIAALFAAFSPLSHAQDHSDWRNNPNLRNDRQVVIVEHRPVVVRHVHARKTVHCRDGSWQFRARGCRGHHGVRR